MLRRFKIIVKTSLSSWTRIFVPEKCFEEMFERSETKQEMINILIVTLLERLHKMLPYFKRCILTLIGASVRQTLDANRSLLKNIVSVGSCEQFPIHISESRSIIDHIGFPTCLDVFHAAWKALPVARNCSPDFVQVSSYPIVGNVAPASGSTNFVWA